MIHGRGIHWENGNGSPERWTKAMILNHLHGGLFMTNYFMTNKPLTKYGLTKAKTGTQA